jgi:hypothetical protein
LAGQQHIARMRRRATATLEVLLPRARLGGRHR